MRVRFLENTNGLAFTLQSESDEEHIILNRLVREVSDRGGRLLVASFGGECGARRDSATFQPDPSPDVLLPKNDREVYDRKLNDAQRTIDRLSRFEDAITDAAVAVDEAHRVLERVRDKRS